MSSKRKESLKTIRVASGSNVKAVAGSIAKSLEQYPRVEVQAVGAGAVNQAVKALAMSRGFISVQGKDLYVAPAFSNIEIENQSKTAIKFIIKCL